MPPPHTHTLTPPPPVLLQLTAVDVAPAILKCSVTLALYLREDLRPVQLHSALQALLQRYPTLGGRCVYVRAYVCTRAGGCVFVCVHV